MESSEMKRAPNRRTCRLSTPLDWAIMSWAGYTDKPVFIEADRATSFERDVIKLQNYLWVDERNRAMKAFVDAHNEKVKQQIRPKEKPKWCLKLDINLLQAVEGVTASMTYGRHSDRGPDLMHLSLGEVSEAAKYLPHLSCMEVLTLSTTRMENPTADCDQEEGKIPGECTLDIYDDSGKGKPKEQIPMKKLVVHGQLAGTQLNLTHWPKPVDRGDVKSIRHLVSCRQTIDLSDLTQALSWLKTLNKVQLEAFKNVIVAHNHKVGEPPKPPGKQTKYVDMVSKFLSVTPTAEQRGATTFMKPPKWQKYVYDPIKETLPPDPTTYAKVKGLATERTTDPDAHLVAASVGRSIEHHVKGATICLADLCEEVGIQSDINEMQKILQRHNIGGYEGRNYVCNQTGVHLLTGIRKTEGYKNEVTSDGRAQKEIERQKKDGGMKVDEILRMVAGAYDLDKESGETVEDREKKKIAAIRELEGLLRPLEDSNNEGTGIVLLDPMTYAVDMGGSSGSTELGGTNGAVTKTGDAKSMSSVILPYAQSSGEGHNAAMMEATKQGITVEMWSPDWKKFAEYKNLKDAAEKWPDSTGKKKEFQEAMKDSNVQERRWVCMGLWTVEGHRYEKHPDYYVEEIQHTHWALVRSYVFRLRPVDIRLQLWFQLHKRKIRKLKRMAIHDKEQTELREPVSRGAIKNRRFEIDPIGLVRRWVIGRAEAQETFVGECKDGAIGADEERDEVEGEGRDENNQDEVGPGNEGQSTDGRDDSCEPWGSGMVTDDEFSSELCRGNASSVMRFFQMNIRDGKADVLSSEEMPFISWAHSTKPVCSPMRTFNPTTLAFITHFHHLHETKFKRVKARSHPNKFKLAVFNVVTNRTSGLPATYFDFARYLQKEYCYFPSPTEMRKFLKFLIETLRSFRTIQSRQFDMTGFPPSIDWRDIEHWVHFLELFAKELDEICNVFLNGGDAKAFKDR